MLPGLGAFFKRWFGSSQAANTVEFTGTERRVWVRRPVELAATYRPADEPESQREPARVRNISLGGMNIVAKHRFDPGMQLAVELPSNHDLGPVTVLAQIIRSEPLPGHEWALGCTFAAELNETDLQRFGAQRVRSGEPGMRSWVRFDCNFQATYQRVRGPEMEPEPATVLDLSAGGAGLVVAKPIDVGSLLNLELRGKDESRNLSILACVVRAAQRAPQEWFLGCNFISELEEEQFKRLA